MHERECKGYISFNRGVNELNRGVNELNRGVNRLVARQGCNLLRAAVTSAVTSQGCCCGNLQIHPLDLGQYLYILYTSVLILSPVYIPVCTGLLDVYNIFGTVQYKVLHKLVKLASNTFVIFLISLKHFFLKSPSAIPVTDNDISPLRCNKIFITALPASSKT